MEQPLSGPVVIWLTDPLPNWWIRFLTESKNIVEELKDSKIRHLDDRSRTGKTMFAGAVIFPNEKSYTWFLMKWS